jgi:hypothetical protein
MPWQYGRALVHRGRSSLTFELALREDGVLREALHLTLNAGLGVGAIKTELRRAAVARVREILADRVCPA